MQCSSEKCLKPSNERTVSCWLCLKFFHLKCSNSGVKARDADAISDPQKHLQWTCSSCRGVNIELYKFFTTYKEKFQRINTEFISLQSKMANFGNLFSDFKKLEEQATLLPTSSTMNKNTNTDNGDTSNNLTTDASIVSANHSSSSHAISSLNSLSATFTGPISAGAGSSCPAITLYRPDCASLLSIENANETDSNYSDDNPENYPSPLGTINNSQQVPRPLRAVPRNRLIFISRLAEDTTTEEVEYFIKSKCGDSALISSYKFVYSQPRSISSFKITVPDELFNNILEPSFWPENTFVREYKVKERSNRVAHLPVHAANTSKN